MYGMHCNSRQAPSLPITKPIVCEQGTYWNCQLVSQYDNEDEQNKLDASYMLPTGVFITRQWFVSLCA